MRERQLMRPRHGCSPTTSARDTAAPILYPRLGPRYLRFQQAKQATCSGVSTSSAVSLIGQVIGTGSNRCEIVDATSCSTCACNFYVKYSTDSGQTWSGLTYQGTPGGTGCPANGLKGNAGATVDAAKAWLLTYYIGQGYCCATTPPTIVPTLVPASPVPSSIVRLPTASPTVQSFPTIVPVVAPLSCSQVSPASAAALVGQVIGTGSTRCEIFDGTTCATCSCNYYVKYSTDSGQSWSGLTFQGTSGGTGCPANGLKGNAGATVDAAKAWLITDYIGQGYCCATAPPTTVPALAPVPTTCSQVSSTSAASLVGQMIGTGSKRCEIFDGTTCATCSCNYYVKYSTDSGQTWSGLTYQGTSGGSGCPANGLKGNAGATVDAAKAWLITYYIGQGYCCA